MRYVKNSKPRGGVSFTKRSREHRTPSEGDNGLDTKTPSKLGFTQTLKTKRIDDYVLIYRSIKEKAELIKSLGLGGAMVWSVETDDFRGICGEKYPLLRTLNEALNQDPAVTTTTRPTTTSTAPTTRTSSTTPEAHTTDVSSNNVDSCDLVCRHPGYLRDPLDCGIFYNCVDNGNGIYSIYQFFCPHGLYFDLSAKSCNWPDRVDCSACS